jgi:nucleoside-diphosphate-sugar epimerase
MIVGTGMLASAFVPLAQRQGKRLCVYAYGVSNSRCIDPVAFMREAIALKESLDRQRDAIFLYFGTCSVDDPEMQRTPYVLHKLRMEDMVAEHDKGIVVRLPQVVGSTRNPATLLNFLANHLINGTPFDLWVKARRNIIDVADVVLIVEQMLADKSFQGRVVNIANPISYSMPEIVSTMEDVLGRKAVYREVDKGSVYAIDITSASAWMDNAGVRIDQDYLASVIMRYYFGI